MTVEVGQMYQNFSLEPLISTSLPHCCPVMKHPAYKIVTCINFLLRTLHKVQFSFQLKTFCLQRKYEF